MFDAKSSLETIKETFDKSQPKQNYFDRLKDATGSMDVSQVTWVMQQKEVQDAYNAMMDAFRGYLFERMKEDFAAIKTYQPVVDDYINAVINSAQRFGEHTKELESENERLKQQIAELMNNAK